MTKRLYYEDSHQREFEAFVTACEPEGNFWRISLDQTAFFPEGGGQAGDSGFLNETEVFDTQEAGGEIWHHTASPFAPGQKVFCRIDWQKRFSRMQQHSGEHIVSGLVHGRFGCDNVGFHLGEREVTLDFNRAISREEMQEIETAANEIVFSNLPILVSYPDKTKLSALSYRSKMEIEGQVRIVTIPEVDVCACCAPHVKRTGEIGLIKLTGVQSHRGGVRVTMLAGDRALLDYREKEASVRAISALLSAKENLVQDAVERQKEEIYRLNGQLMKLNMMRIQEKASALPDKAQSPVFFEEDLNADASREFVNLLTERCEGIACVFSGNDTQGYRYVLGSHTLDTRPLCRHLNQTFGGKGGGKPEMVQGSVSGSRQELLAAIEEWKGER